LTRGSRRKNRDKVAKRYVEYHTRSYIQKEVNLEEKLRWKRYIAHEARMKAEYKDINSQYIKEYLDKI